MCSINYLRLLPLRDDYQNFIKFLNEDLNGLYIGSYCAFCGCHNFVNSNTFTGDINYFMTRKARIKYNKEIKEFKNYLIDTFEDKLATDESKSDLKDCIKYIDDILNIEENFDDARRLRFCHYIWSFRYIIRDNLLLYK